MKSKIMVFFLASLMVIGSLSGCGYTLNDEAETSAQTAEEETVGQIEEDVAGQTDEETAGQVEEDAAAKEAAANEYYEAGRAYLYGLDGKEVDLESAYNNFEQAEELGKVEANFYLGLLCDNYNYPETDFQMASTYYAKCGDNPYAQLALGFLYYYGQGVEKDVERAKELWQSAIEQGCVEGYLGTASVLLDEEEYEAALEDYIKASEGTERLFISSAMSNVGWMYFEGKGIEQDYEMALEWYEKAADLGNMYAMNNIGDMYCEGYGVEQDYETALEWYEKAADLGNEFANENAENIRQLIQ
ncbi:MAG: sel1 repeat family protein [Lachnospiraceae bacterium]|nr:sel1 repeat family protein [Lachnospiraceae bacterium]